MLLANEVIQRVESVLACETIDCRNCVSTLKELREAAIAEDLRSAGVVGDVERPDGPTVSRLWSAASVQSAVQGTTAEWAFAHLLWAEFVLREREGSQHG